MIGAGQTPHDPRMGQSHQQGGYPGYSGYPGYQGAGGDYQPQWPNVQAPAFPAPTQIVAPAFPMPAPVAPIPPPAPTVDPGLSAIITSRSEQTTEAMRNGAQVKLDAQLVAIEKYRTSQTTEYNKQLGSQNKLVWAGVVSTIAGMFLNLWQNNNASNNALSAYIRSAAANEKISGDQRTVAEANASVRRHAIDKQAETHATQTRHEEKMQRLTNSLNAQLAYIQEDHRTARMRIALTAGAFRPNEWFMGQPAGV